LPTFAHQLFVGLTGTIAHCDGASCLYSIKLENHTDVHMFVCVFCSAFVGGLKDVATHLQSDHLATVSSVFEIYFNSNFFTYVFLNTTVTAYCTFLQKFNAILTLSQILYAAPLKYSFHVIMILYCASV